MDILLTGGTGSLGHAVVEKLLDSATFDRVCIYSRDEHKQENMRLKFKDHPKLRFFIGDVRDKERLNLAMRGIHIVVHMAALKVVPVAEYNPFEAIKTNILGAQNVIECALNTNIIGGGYPKVLAISTDKAVHPINLYGATKLCAEKLFIAANNIMGPSGPRFSVARYGNVSGSNGSVIPLFKEQISRGEQLTITHDEMTRFCITLEEATNLVFYSLSKMHGGETFVPDMPAYNVKDIAMLMMIEAKYPLENQWTRIIGVRPGEKLHEVIITKEEMEKVLYDEENRIHVITPNGSFDEAIMPKYVDLTSDKAVPLYGEELRDKLRSVGAF